MVHARRYQLPPNLGCRARHCIIVLVAIALGCTQGAEKGPLQERAKQYLDLKQRKRWEEIYDGYLDPTLKSKLTKEAFLKQRQLAFDVLNHTITEVEESGDQGTVKLNGAANFPAREPGGKVRILERPFTLTDHWVKRDGTWYIVLAE